MPIRPVTDPALLQQLNAGGGEPLVANPLFHAQAAKANADAASAQGTAPYAAPKARADLRSTDAQTNKVVAETPLDVENKRLQNQVLKQQVAQGSGALNQRAMLGIRQDAATKINEIRNLRNKIEHMSFPNVTGAGFGTLLKVLPMTPARGVANELKQIGSAGALATALQMAKNNGGKNPLTPMSNSDIEMISNITAALDQGQNYTDLKKQLDNAEAAFGHAYMGAGGKPDALMDRNRADGPFPGHRQQNKQQSRVIDFNDLPEH